MADIKNSKTPAVQGNALKNLKVDDLSREELGILAVRNPDSYNQKLLGYIDPTYLQLRLQVKDELLEILNNAHKNNYTVKIPIEHQTHYKNLGLTEGGLDAIKSILPDLTLINASYLLTAKDIESHCWNISWDFDGLFGTQIAEIKGLVFSRHATYDSAKNKTTWTSWGFHNDTQYIGMTRMDFSNLGHGKNVMGWIKVPAGGIKLKRSEYPKLFDYLTKSGAFSQDKGIINVTSTDLEISNPAGYFPRIVGQQTTGGISSNPDCSGAAPSDNYDYANIRLYGDMYPREWGFIVDADNGTAFNYSGVLDGTYSKVSEDDGVPNIKGVNRYGMPLIFNTDRVSSWKGGYNETRPKNKFYNMLVYAGYPIVQIQQQQDTLHK